MFQTGRRGEGTHVQGCMRCGRSGVYPWDVRHLGRYATAADLPNCQSRWKVIVKRGVAGFAGRSRELAATALRRGLAVALMRGVVNQLDNMHTTLPPV